MTETPKVSRQIARQMARSLKKNKERAAKRRGKVIEQYKPRCPDCDVPFKADDHANQCTICKMMICDGCVKSNKHECKSSRALSMKAAKKVLATGRKVAVLHNGKLEVLKTMEEYEALIGKDEGDGQ